MADATINITACDNELYLNAVNSGWSQSYQLAHIESGNSNSVDVTVTVTAGTYNEPATLNGVSGPLNQSQSYTVSLPAGTYYLLPIGINWASSQQFIVTLNGTTYSLPLTTPDGQVPTVVWNPSTATSPITFSIS